MVDGNGGDSFRADRRQDEPCTVRFATAHAQLDGHVHRFLEDSIHLYALEREQDIQFKYNSYLYN